MPIAYSAARYNIDMDLLTRGAGFGYMGSTVTSLIYASFTFIYFSLEGSVMAQALSLYFHLPLAVSYLIASLVIIPLTVYGMTFLNRFHGASVCRRERKGASPVPVEMSHSVSASGTSERTRKPAGFAATWSAAHIRMPRP